MQATAESRLLTPVTDRFRGDGAPCVKLSPSRGLKNANIIYQAIKSAPDKTLLRGDFDCRGEPWVYFPAREKKHIGKLSAPSPIKARNIDIDRQDMANFLASITDAASAMPSPDQRSLCAVAQLRKMLAEVKSQKRDFSAGEIRIPLRTLSHAYKRIERQIKINANKALLEQQSRVQSQRFIQFCTIPGATFTRLSDILKPPSAARYDVSASLAVLAMKDFLKAYLKSKTDQQWSFSDYLRSTAISRDVHFFAKRWMAISNPGQTTGRMKCATEAWAKEMDTICPLIVKAYHRQARVDRPDSDGPHAEARLIYQRQDNRIAHALPPLPSVPPAPSPVLEAVPKSAIAPAISIDYSAYPTDLADTQLIGVEFEELSGAEHPGLHRSDSNQQGRASRSDSMFGTRFASNSTLISELNDLLKTPLPDNRYSAIATPDDAGRDPSSHARMRGAALTGQISAPGMSASSGRRFMSTGDNFGLSSQGVPSVSATEIDPSTESLDADSREVVTAIPFKLELELSDSGESSEQANT